MRRTAAAWIGGATWLIAALAEAQASDALPLELSWQAPAECPTADAVRSELASIARVQPGYSLGTLRARADVRRGARGYVLALATEHEGQAGERQLQASDCHTLVRSLTLVLALAFGPGVRIEPRGASDPAPRAPPPSASPASPEVLPLPAAPDADSPPVPDAQPEDPDTAGAGAGSAPRVAVWLGAGVQFALLPSAAFSALAGAELQLERVSFALHVQGFPGVSRELRPNVEASFDGLGGALRACWLFDLGGFAPCACAAAQAAALRGRAAGPAPLQDGSATAPWYALAGAVTLGWPRDAKLRLRVEAGLAVSLNRPRFAIDGLGSAHSVPRFAPQLSAGLLFVL